MTKTSLKYPSFFRNFSAMKTHSKVYLDIYMRICKLVFYFLVLYFNNAFNNNDLKSDLKYKYFS